MTLDEMISDIDYVVNKNQLATLELGDESTKQLLNFLEDYKRLQSVSSWIPCNERLPDEPGIHVLVTDGIHFMESWYEVIDGEVLWVDNYTMYVNINFGEVSHWMPLPEVPQRKDDTHDYD